MNVSRTIIENSQLRQKLAQLKEENYVLREKVAFLETHTTIAEGIRGESLVALWIEGARTTHNATHDIDLKEKNLRIEVKFSRLNDAVRSCSSKKTMRWSWLKVFGESGNKQYDRLLLVAEKDPLHRDEYIDPHCPYILFDVPFDEVHDLTISGGRYRIIQLTTNPRSARSRASILYRQYQVTIDALEERYAFSSLEKIKKC